MSLHAHKVLFDVYLMISGGSLFLFDQKALKFFRRDGHIWRKKKNINTVRENHVKLKVGGIDVLHYHYARGEANKNIQR